MNRSERLKIAEAYEEAERSIAFKDQQVSRLSQAIADVLGKEVTLSEAKLILNHAMNETFGYSWTERYNMTGKKEIHDLLGKDVQPKPPVARTSKRPND